MRNRKEKSILKNNFVQEDPNQDTSALVMKDEEEKSVLVEKDEDSFILAKFNEENSFQLEKAKDGFPLVFQRNKTF